ncbi:purine-binding chemotaxis protein CheW [Oscillatoriales cyanobacterium LEGE 11467]|uniref:Purine-binding chemotaxis protein CheW n=1 Tax=Zarconia navalis LEGE 11467 TaxID=1828826 RepID=A0A928Z7C9_9CYAN|nr:chemotaxis protein CheW [Zarconia navalis]MBE9039548.1 purine-binding chemotaxis protein CheW [Zarconia navalis LEGE 11467]
METTPYLIFSLKYSRYGVEARAVREVFFLPQLSPAVEAPEDIVGVLNLRGTIVPVMDLNLRFGYRWREYTLSDSVIVLEREGLCLGIIVDRAFEVQTISLEAISPALDYGRDVSVSQRYPEATSRRFVSGVASVDSDIITLLDCDRLMRDSQDVEPEVPQSALPADSLGLSARDGFKEEPPPFALQGTAREREIFRSRAEVLRQTVQEEETADAIPLAVVGLNGEYFGMDLRTVREFTEIHHVTPVPCCPPHIIGNINLRGEIVTLVAIRGLLNLPFLTGTLASKAIVVQVDEVVAGITVDEVFDVTHVDPSAIAPLPATVSSSDEGFLRGTAPYKDKIVTVLDVANILTSEQSIVDEEVG